MCYKHFKTLAYPNAAIHNQYHNRIQQGLQSISEHKLGPDIRKESQNPLHGPWQPDEKRKDDDVAKGTHSNHAGFLDGREQGGLVVEGHSVGQEVKPGGKGNILF